MERFGGIFLVAGLAFFIFSFVAMGVIPYLHFVDLPTQTAEELAGGVMDEVRELATEYPEAFRAAFPTFPATPAELKETHVATMLREGRDVYIAEGCWHCHSQFIRPVSNEDLRWGKISAPAEYHNELQMPQLFGTRRVGPDLIRQSGTHTNDWHVAHFYNPRFVSPTSVMPPFPWFFDESAEMPVLNRKGFSIVAYVQWLGSWTHSRPSAIHRGGP